MACLGRAEGLARGAALGAGVHRGQLRDGGVRAAARRAALPVGEGPVEAVEVDLQC